MFVRASTLVLAVAASVIAAPGTSNTINQCNTGSMQCCNKTSDFQSVSDLAGLFGIVLDPVEGLIGLGCTPINIVGFGSGASCTQQPVCCTNTQQNGLINVGCTPINLNV